METNFWGPGERRSRASSAGSCASSPSAGPLCSGGTSSSATTAATRRSPTTPAVTVTVRRARLRQGESGSTGKAGLSVAGGRRPCCAPKQARDLRHPVSGCRGDSVDHHQGSEASWRRDGFFDGAPYLGAEPASPPARPYGRSRRRDITGRDTLDLVAEALLRLGSGPEPALPGEVSWGPWTSAHQGIAPAGGRSRSTGGPGEVERVRQEPQEGGLGCLREAAPRGAQSGVEVPLEVHAPGRNLQPPSRLAPGRQGELPLERLRPRLRREDHDAGSGGVHPPVPAPCSSQGFCADPPLRLSFEPSAPHEARRGTESPGGAEAKDCAPGRWGELERRERSRSSLRSRPPVPFVQEGPEDLQRGVCASKGAAADPTERLRHLVIRQLGSFSTTQARQLSSCPGRCFVLIGSMMSPKRCTEGTGGAKSRAMSLACELNESLCTIHALPEGLRRPASDPEQPS